VTDPTPDTPAPVPPTDEQVAESSAPPAESDGAPPGAYRNLWVPLVVVPAAVVGVLVLVFVLFSSIAGKEAGPHENLQRMIRGGSNERQQAAFSLVRQVRAAAEGIEQDWQPTPEFLAEVRAAWDEVGAEDHSSRIVLAMILAQNGDPAALPRLVELLEVGDEADPEGTIRFNALAGLSSLRDPSVARHVIPLLDSPDHVLRLGAASVLQSVPGEETVAALRRAVRDELLEVRGMAAISLSILGDDGGAEVLIDLTDPETYAREQAADPARFADPRLVQHSRVKAIEALGRLARPADRAPLEALASGAEDDLVVREAAKRALAAREGG